MNSNAIQIPAGQAMVTVTGLGLTTAPSPPSLTVVAPPSAPDYIFAFIIGPTTTDGFTIGLSAPPSVSGYSVEWDLSIPQSVPTPTANTIQVAAGQLLIPVTGLNLNTPPPAPTLTVTAPSGSSDSVFAYLVGSTTTDGFVIGLSAIPSVNGYTVTWSIPSTQPTPAGSLTNPVPLLPFPWKDRSALISGRQSINGNSFYLCIDPYGKTFFVYPEVDDNHQVTVNWDGIRNTFASTDCVPFDEECAGVVAEYVNAWMAKGRNDWSTWGAAMKPAIGSYTTKLRKLFLNAQNRVQMRDA